ncbi:DsbE family thiol:disulfide interchange protein [Yoonia sediminilitoris]|uniref:Cytochrome c biogenesis protein CcmG/thiol:disulfide interchange protein DsbE n=1 Tax=Yoonia sediminilitoris TaxID=1286148 RepID=A0A2T6KDQ6_9RHOB|nr:DsbE family thiol:disulfide interchange protein [Yoonia sediminilitoris]PUB13182.1 cytochrome c biogenesis protein CcmG/thiol:disulfide interchange protein DsbE [Yoonia sediminilitoris]RCW94517.1 cytochrome c biogenesis protein CcmG/thiol:disulfide interchange protein DsbE [Yoonia sediminilitoris]
MAKLSPLMIAPLVTVVALLGLGAAGLLLENRDELPSTFVGQQAPAVPVEAVQGTTQLTDADLRSGEVTIVNFWASWCPPCRAEHPKLLELDAAGYRVAGINFRDQQDQAAPYLADYEDPFFATGFDLRGRVAIDWGVTAPPETFIVDGDGTVLFRFVGPLVGSDYEQRFLPELAKAVE